MADVKFDIEVTGIKELRQAADNFQRLGKVSSQLSAQYKPLGAQTQRLVAENNRYARVKKQVAAAVAQGIITEKEATRALQESLRVSRERILTDRTLIDQAKKRAKAAEENRKETERLVKAYAPARVAANLYKNKVQEIDQAEKRGIISKQEAAQALSLLTKEYYDFTQGVATGGNQFAKFNVETYRANQRLKRFTSTGLQQAGYQIGDFAVQVQAGTNVAVAFGQQMSQLLGIFGAGGALAGAAVAIGTAFIAPLIDAQDEVKNLADDMQALFDKLEANKDTAAGLIEGGFAGPLERARQTAIDVLEVFNEIDRKAARQAFAAGSKEISDFLEEQFQAAGIKAKGGIDIPGVGVAFQGTTTRGRESDPARRKAAAQLQGDIAKLQVLILQASLLPTDKLAEETLNLFKSLENNPAASGELVKRYKELLETSGLWQMQQDAIAKAQAQAQREGAARTKSDQEAVNEAIRRERERQALRKESEKVAQSTIPLAQAELLLGKQLQEVDQEAIRLATIAAQERIAGVGLQEAAEKNLSEFLQEQAKKEEAAYNAQVERNRQAFAKLEDDKVNAHAEGVRKRLAEEDKLRKQQERADANQLQANQILGLRNDLLAVEAKYGKESKQYREEAVYVEGQIAAIRARAKNVSEDLVTDAILLAREAENNKFNIADAADEAKRLADELKEAAKAMTALEAVGDTVSMALIKANAQLDAVSAGTDKGVAGRIAELREKNTRAMNEAIAAGGAMADIIAEYAETEADIVLLAAALERLAEASKKTKKTDYQKAAEDYSKFIEELKLETSIQSKLIGLSEEERGIQRALLEAKHKYRILGKAFNQEEVEGELRKQAALEKTQKRLEEAYEQQKQLVDFMGDSFENAFMSIVDGTKSAKDAFRDMAREIIAELYRVLVVQRMVNAAKMAFGFADGGVFQNGNVVPFANGGVVGSPTYFPMSGGRTGLMGEAGPEAIMPLKRGKNGKLGVVAEGGGETVVVNNSFNFAANGDDSVKKIIAQSVPQITEAAKAGVLDARKRGGQFRKVFG